MQSVYTFSPKLFTLVMEDVFEELDWEDKWINIDGAWLNHLRFADDVVIISQDIEELRTTIQELDTVSNHVGLKMNPTKTKLMSHDKRTTNNRTQPLQTVDEYVYLGHLMQLGKTNQTAEPTREIRASWAAFGKLKTRMYQLV